MVFIFQFVNVVYHIDWFADIEESLHSWDKAHLVMVYDFFNMLQAFLIGGFKSLLYWWGIFSEHSENNSM